VEAIDIERAKELARLRSGGVATAALAEALAAFDHASLSVPPPPPPL
jgi:hypothetical protein